VGLSHFSRIRLKGKSLGAAEEKRGNGQARADSATEGVKIIDLAEELCAVSQVEPDFFLDFSDCGAEV